MENALGSSIALIPDTTSLCRLCGNEEDKKHMLSLKSRSAMEEGLPQRMSHLLGIDFCINLHKFPTSVCRSCKRQFDHIEKALTKLETFKAMARRSMAFFETRSCLKRTKQCSGTIGVSPEMLRVRPASKRQPLSSRREINFCNGKALCIIIAIGMHFIFISCYADETTLTAAVTTCISVPFHETSTSISHPHSATNTSDLFACTSLSFTRALPCRPTSVHTSLPLTSARTSLPFTSAHTSVPLTSARSTSLPFTSAHTSLSFTSAHTSVPLTSAHTSVPLTSACSTSLPSFTSAHTSLSFTSAHTSVPLTSARSTSLPFTSAHTSLPFTSAHTYLPSFTSAHTSLPSFTSAHTSLPSFTSARTSLSFTSAHTSVPLTSACTSVPLTSACTSVPITSAHTSLPFTSGLTFFPLTGASTAVPFGSSVPLTRTHTGSVLVTVVHSPVPFVSTSASLTSTCTSLPFINTCTSVSSFNHQPISSPSLLDLGTNRFSELQNAIATGNASSIGKAIMNNKELADIAINLVTEAIDSECSVLCRKSPDNPSLFRKIPTTDMASFQWSDFVNELKKNAPVFFQLICSIVSHSDHRNMKKSGDSHFPGVCMAIAMILKERNREICGIQSLISLLLYQSHTQKQVNYFYQSL